MRRSQYHNLSKYVASCLDLGSKTIMPVHILADYIFRLNDVDICGNVSVLSDIFIEILAFFGEKAFFCQLKAQFLLV